jgi:hypothetical protein
MRVHILANGVVEDALHVGEPWLGARAPDTVPAITLLDAENGARATHFGRGGAGTEDPLATQNTATSKASCVD